MERENEIKTRAQAGQENNHTKTQRKIISIIKTENKGDQRKYKRLKI